MWCVLISQRILCLCLLLSVLSGCNEPPLTSAPTETSVSEATLLLPTVRLMWVNSYADDNSWSLEIRRGIEDVLTRAGYVDNDGSLIWKSVAMNVPSGMPLPGLYPLADAVIAEIQTFQPDVVIVSDDEAARTIIPRYPDLDLPFVFCGLNSDPQEGDLIRYNVTGVLEVLHPIQNLAIARAFVPPSESNNYIILSDASTSGNINAWKVYETLRAYEPDAVSPAFWVTGQWELWQKIVLDTADYDFILLISSNFVWDSRGHYVEQAELMAWMLENSAVPVFAMSETAVRSGAVAGLVAPGYDQGAAAAEVALRIAQGSHPASIRTAIPAHNTLVMNLAAAANWRLPIPVAFPLVAHVYTALPHSGGPAVQQGGH